MRCSVVRDDHGERFRPGDLAALLDECDRDERRGTGIRLAVGPGGGAAEPEAEAPHRAARQTEGDHGLVPPDEALNDDVDVRDVGEPEADRHRDAGLRTADLGHERRRRRPRSDGPRRERALAPDGRGRARPPCGSQPAKAARYRGHAKGRRRGGRRGRGRRGARARRRRARRAPSGLRRATASAASRKASRTPQPFSPIPPRASTKARFSMYCSSSRLGEGDVGGFRVCVPGGLLRHFVYREQLSQVPCVSLTVFARLRARVFSELLGPLTQRNAVTGGVV